MNRRLLGLALILMLMLAGSGSALAKGLLPTPSTKMHDPVTMISFGVTNGLTPHSAVALEDGSVTETYLNAYTRYFEAFNERLAKDGSYAVTDYQVKTEPYTYEISKDGFILKLTYVPSACMLTANYPAGVMIEREEPSSGDTKYTFGDDASGAYGFGDDASGAYSFGNDASGAYGFGDDAFGAYGFGEYAASDDDFFESQSNSANKTCVVCNGTRKCHVCSGKGTFPCPVRSCLSGKCKECKGTGLYDHGSYLSRCIVCSGDGRCDTCNGTSRRDCSICHGTGKCTHCY